MDRPLPTLAVVALVVLAGCSLGVGGGGGGSPTPAVSPTDTPSETPTGHSTPSPSPATSATTSAARVETSVPSTSPPVSATTARTHTDPPVGTPTPAPELVPVSSMAAPPGITGNRVSNRSALLGGHRAVLAGTPYRVDLHVTNSTGRDGTITVRNGSAAVNATIRVANRRLAADYFFGPPISGAYNRTTGRISYSYGSTGVQLTTAFATAVYRSLGPQTALLADWYAIGTRSSPGGEDLLVLTATGVNRTETGFTLLSEDEIIRSIDGRMAVTAGGVVRELHVTMRVEHPDGDGYTLTIDHTLTARGAVTVSRPDWLARPPQLKAASVADRRLLVVTHTGGANIDQDVTLSVGPSVGAGTNVTLPEAVSAGETIYLYRTGSRTAPNVVVTVDDRPVVPENATRFADSAVIRGQFGPYQFVAGPVDTAEPVSVDAAGH